MKSIIIDTNGYLRLFLNDIPQQANQVKKLLEKAKNKQVRILIPQIIIFEINFVLKKYYHQEKEEIIPQLQSLVSTPYMITESQELFSNALTIYKENHISLADAFLFSKSQIENIELFTFDKKLDKLQ